MSVTLRPGDVVDRYTVEELLGEGGMAAVYAVRHNTLGSSHALKLLKIESASIRERLVAEGQAQASLRHPNIVSVTDVLTIKGQPALLMERIDGPGLDGWLADNRPDLEDALKLFRGILAGVARAHRAGLVHRDLKPGNVLLDSADGLIIPKVADFGLAKILHEDGAHSQTRTGFSMGTPQFMAPEQIRNAKDVDPRADIFALGCILYVLVCGRLPFEDPDLLELYNRIATGRYQPPESMVPGLPAHVRDTICACLQVKREDRPEDCDAVRLMLYGSDDALTGGVKIKGASTLRPARRAEPLMPATTRIDGPTRVEPARPAAANTWVAPERPAAKKSTFPVFAVVFALGSLSLAGLLVLVVAGLAWRETTAVTPPVAVVAEPVAVVVEPVEPAPVGPDEPALDPVDPGGPATATLERPSKRQVVATAVATTSPAGEPAGETTPVAAPTAATGTLRVEGTVAELTLVRGGRSWGPGEVPAGVYEARYQFSGKPARTLPGVTVRAGEETVVRCDPTFSNCR